MRVIGQCHAMLHQNGIVRIQSDIRVGSRTDKKQGFKDKVEAVEKLLKQVGDGKRVPVKNARMGMPVIAVVAGAATNSHVLSDTALPSTRHHGRQRVE